MTFIRDSTPAPSTPGAAVSPDYLDLLESVQRRVLWLATRMVHHANHDRPNLDGTKVGGHQASSASVVSIMTALYFHYLRAGDRVSIKPHASPAFHAIQYLLGQLPREYLTTLRAFKGLQAYPSRTKDPDRVDFSTGSVGLGAVAPAFAALAHRYVTAHFGRSTSRRFVAVIGDAELDEGNVWEAILDEALEGLDNLLWIVDLNRQSLDRVVPGIRAARLKRLFAESGWQVLEAKYGCRLQAAFAHAHGPALRRRIDDMSNEEYQALIRLAGAELRTRLVDVPGADADDLVDALRPVPDAELPSLVANLGGHDFSELIRVLEDADADHRHPTVVFAYTIKGWGLPFAGHPLNHSMLLNAEQMAGLRTALRVPGGDDWAAFDDESPEGRLCTEAAERLFPAASSSPIAPDPLEVPDSLGVLASGMVSTQDTFGRLLTRLADVPALRPRIVTASPDVSVSTNLAGWINKAGVFDQHDHTDFETEVNRLLRWTRSPKGQHIELGISEMNLFMLLGMFGLSAELCGRLLVPVGTVYDPFVCRGLDALIYALYSNAKFIFAGTPSGITLSPEGGAHQSTVTPSLGMELPMLHSYEPCFAVELEWILLEAIRQCFDREAGRATYLRLTTRPVDQSLLEPALARLGREALKQQVLDGGYRLVDWREGGAEVDQRFTVHLVTSGAMVPEVVGAAAMLHLEGVAAVVHNLTSPRRLYERWKLAQPNGRQGGEGALGWLFPESERRAPIVTVHDGASHTLAWLGSALGAPVTPLGVDAFGQSGARDDLYRYYRLDVDSIAEAAFKALDAYR